MLSGTLSSHTLHVVFRTLSHKKRHGILEINSGESLIRLMFHNGRIVQVESLERPLAKSICEKLSAAERLSRAVPDELVEGEGDVDGAYQHLVGGKYVTHDDFVSAKTAIEHNLLLSLRSIDGGFFHFTPKMVRFDPRLSVSVPPGHLLLDLVEMDTDEERFANIFGSSSEARKIQKQTTELPGNLTESEHIILSALDDAASFQKISDLTLLNERSLREGLLALYSRNLISVEASDFVASAEQQQSSLDNLFVENRSNGKDQQTYEPDYLSKQDQVDDLLFPEASPGTDVDDSDSVKALVDDAVDLLASAENQTTEDESPAPEADIQRSDEPVDQLFESALSHDDLLKDLSDALEKVDEELSQFGDAEPESMALPTAVSASADEDLGNADSGDDAAAKAVSVLREQENKFIKAEPSSAVQRFMQDLRKQENRVVLGMLMFIIVLALVGPGLFDRWFDALSHFPSMR